MVVLCFLWGMGQVAAPLAAPRVSLMMQRSIRSAVAAPLILLSGSVRGIALFKADEILCGPGCWWHVIRGRALVHLCRSRSYQGVTCGGFHLPGTLLDRIDLHGSVVTPVQGVPR